VITAGLVPGWPALNIALVLLVVRITTGNLIFRTAYRDDFSHLVQQADAFAISKACSNITLSTFDIPEGR